MRKKTSPRLTTKSEQLRVRLNKDERIAIERAINEAGPDQTISKYIRELIRNSSMGAGTTQMCAISKDVYQTLEDLAKELNRDPNQVLEDCVRGIAHLVENESESNPLIVEEIKLRRNYARMLTET